MKQLVKLLAGAAQSILALTAAERWPDAGKGLRLLS